MLYLGATMINVIFLDFDGPLTNQRAYVAYDKPAGRPMWTTGDPVAIEMINALCCEYDARVVISSSWRGFDDFTPTGLGARESLISWGFKGEFHDSWRTYGNGPSREAEILKWMEFHHSTVDNYCCIDDAILKKKMNPVIVDAQEGMMFKNYLQAKNFLSGGGWSVEKLMEILS